MRAGTQTLVAQRLDVEKAALTGEPVTLADGVGGVSVAATGLVAYRTAAAGRRQLTWFDRSGAARATFGDPDSANLATPRVSPDGRRVVVERTVERNVDLWLLDGTRTSRLTFDAAAELSPVWSPDGTRVAFTSYRTGAADLYQMLANGGGVPERIVTSDQLKLPTSWSADGRFLLYFSVATNTHSDLWAAPMVGDHTPSPFLKTAFVEVHGVFSPDGRWVAYESDASGRDEVYVRPFVPPSPQASADTSALSRDAAADTLRPGSGQAAGGQWQVSTAGGVYPAWRSDGKELYYLSAARDRLRHAVCATSSPFCRTACGLAAFEGQAASSASDSVIGTSTPSAKRAAITSSPFIASMNFLSVPT